MSNKYNNSQQGMKQLTSEYKISQNRKPDKIKQNLSGKIPWNSSVRINSRPSELKSHKHLKVKLNAALNSSDKSYRQQLSGFSTNNTQKCSYLADGRNTMTENNNGDNSSSHLPVSWHLINRSKSNERMCNERSDTCACQCYIRYNDLLEIYAWYLRLRTIMEHRFSPQQLHSNNEVYMHRTVTEHLNQLEALLNKTLPDELRPSTSPNCPIIFSQQNYSTNVPPQNKIILSKQVVPTSILRNLIEGNIHRIYQQENSWDTHYEKNNVSFSADKCCFLTPEVSMKENKKDSLEEQSGEYTNKINCTKESVENFDPLIYESVGIKTRSVKKNVIQIAPKAYPSFDCQHPANSDIFENNKTDEVNRLTRHSVSSEQKNSYKDDKPRACYTTNEFPYSIDRALTQYIKANYLDFCASGVPALGNQATSEKLVELKQPEYSIMSRKSPLERNMTTEMKQLKIGVVFTKLYSILHDMNYDAVYTSVLCVINALGLVQQNYYFVSNNIINIRYFRDNDIYETKIVVQSFLPQSEDFEPTVLVKAVLLRRSHNSIYTRQPMLEDITGRPEGDVMPISSCNSPLLEKSGEESLTIKASKMHLTGSIGFEPFLLFTKMPETNEKQNKTVFSQMSTHKKYGATYLLWRLADQGSNLKNS
uniref:Uncharacterized protein n=1 Tax=Trichobilharzia regenti TaxID=157069 RepID=A0AA85KKT2_TRIRE|nr:unnamed protein product [Trichobilharzia regenti]